MKPITFAQRAAAAVMLAAVLHAAVLYAAPACAADATAPQQTQRLHALFDQRWEALMQLYPEFATFVGDHRYGDRLHDASPASRAADYAAARQSLAQAQAIPRDVLAPPDQVSLDIFVGKLQDHLRFEPFEGYRSLSLGALGGFQTDFADLLAASPVSRRAEVEQMLARMAAYPRRVEQEIVRLREGMALGWVPPRSVLERVLPQIDAEAGTRARPEPVLRALHAPGQRHSRRGAGGFARGSTARHRRAGAARAAPPAQFRD